MNTKSQKVLVIDDDTTVGRSFDRVFSDKDYEVTTTLLNAISETVAANEVADVPESAVESKTATVPETRERSGLLGFAKVVGMFIGAPLIALGYVLALPLIGLYQIGKLAYKAFKKNHRSAATMVKNIGLFFASPFIALGYVIALPVVGLVMFTKLAREASK